MMKSQSASLALSFMWAVFPVSADTPTIEKSEPRNGVYVTYGWHSIVLELKDGHFRYWFSSDVKGKEVSYPLEGTYTATGDKIVLNHDMLIPLSSNWTFKTIDAVPTLWRSDALKALADKDPKFDIYALGKKNFFRTGGGSILVPTQKSAEDAWKSPQVATLSEEEHKALTDKSNPAQAGGNQPAPVPDSKSKGDGEVHPGTAEPSK